MSMKYQRNIDEIIYFRIIMGWGDFSCFGNELAKTPHIDKLAQEGVRFEQFYVNSPICSPSRTAISTGQYPQRWRITSYLSNRDQNKQRGMAQWLDPKAPMLARSLQQAGYVAVSKSYKKNRPLTTCTLTTAGHQAFGEYVGLLERIVKQARSKS